MLMTNNYKTYDLGYTSTIKGCPMGRQCKSSMIGDKYPTKIKIQNKTALRTIIIIIIIIILFSLVLIIT